MSSGLSNSMRVFRGCRVLLAPTKSASAAAKITSSTNTSKTKTNPKPKDKSNPTSSTSTASATPKIRSKKEFSRPTGILKVALVSPALGNFLGVPEASRSDAVKQIWSYVKLHNLQNPADKREIYCDDRLKTIFDGKEKVGFLEIGKLLSSHFVKTN